MISRRSSRKPDLFMVLTLAVVLGVSATIAYQISVYQNNDDLSLARHAQTINPASGG